VIGELAYTGGNAYARFARRSRSWSVADGVNTNVSGLNLDARQTADMGQLDVSMKINVEYAYQVNGEQWKNECITPSLQDPST
jgi:hypothetical protein